ncbi:MAG: hypothetical protein WCT50_02495 [Patescibacteria group bacterium]
MDKMEKNELGKPFHKSVVSAINCWFVGDLKILAELIKATTIPEDHDIIIDAWKKRIEQIDSIDDDFGVIENVLRKKPADHVLIMYSAKTLEEAILLGFDHIPGCASFIGPKGKIRLNRNSLPKGHEFVAEVAVMSIEKDDKRILFCAGWGEHDQKFHLNANWGEKIEDWSDKW